MRLMRWLEHRVPPPLVGLICGALMWWLAGERSVPHWPTGVAGVGTAMLIGAGLVFDLSGLWAFRASRTTINPVRPERASALVTHGVYRFTRNPMYVGMACLLLAWSLVLGTPWSLLGPLAYALYLTQFQIRPEERVLLNLFGEEYRLYMQRVRRWL